MPIKKITKPNSSEPTTGFSWDKFSNDCADNKYVLVVGNEVILNKKCVDVEEANGDSLKLLFNLTKQHLANQEDITTKCEDFTQLSLAINHIRTKVLDTIAGLDFRVCFDAEFEPTLLQLLSTKCFRMVLTTTIDPYLEIAMEQVWGKGGFRVLSIYGDNKDILPNELNDNEFNEITPTLYYLFGKADVRKRECKFVLSENDAMDTIKKWFSKESPENLLKYIQGNNILSVGCKFDNWLFRFFWYILRGDIKRLSTGQVAVEFTEADDKLRSYLDQQKIKYFLDARDFLQKATDKIDKATFIDNLPRRVGGIFISYSSEDKYIALPLFRRLEKAGYNVWIDEYKLNGGDKYDQRIADAINQCTIFMPILSTQVMHDLIQCNMRYYQTEWSLAQHKYDSLKGIDGQTGQNNFNVLPIVIGQYKIRSDYHQRTTECIVKSTAYEVEKGTFDQLRKIINNLK